MSHGSRGLLSENDFLFAESPDDFLSLAIFRETSRTNPSRYHEKPSKPRQKRCRTKRFEDTKSSPPHKRKLCDEQGRVAASHQVNMPLDCFFLSTPKKYAKPPQTSCWQRKKRSDSCFVVKSKEMKTFFKLTEDDVIRRFLCSDSCCRVADKYLLAMVFAYFKRADLSLWEYTRFNFFIALYLANDVEEDEEEIKYEIFPWALGKKWKEKYPAFLKKRDKLLRLIDYKAIVSRRCSDEIMAIEPDHSLWKRERPQHHGGAIRNYMKDPEDDGYPRGPGMTPRYCAQCACDAQEDSQYDSASPDSVSWCVESVDSSPDDEGCAGWIRDLPPPPHHHHHHHHNNTRATSTAVSATASCSFDMKGLQRTLPTQHDIFPGTEE